MNYYYKYIKYKIKYFKLKGGQKRKKEETNRNEITLNSIYLYFINNYLEQLIIDSTEEQINNYLPKNYVFELPNISGIKRSKREIRPNVQYFNENTINSITPYIERMAITTTEKKRIFEDIKYDNQIIDKLNKTNDLDKDYQDIENHGKLIEIWIADNCKCPICKQYTLRRYTKMNFPIIDLVCINSEHYGGPIFYQVKSSILINNKSAKFKDKHYFNLDINDPNQNTIMAGSRKWGELIHDIKPSDIEENKNLSYLLIGYICILYRINRKRNGEINSLSINPNLSFIVLPNINLIKSSYIDNDYFYKYTNNQDKEITFNLNTNNIINLCGEKKNNLNEIKTKLSFDDDDLPNKIPEPLIESNYISINYDKYKDNWITIENPLRN